MRKLEPVLTLGVAVTVFCLSVPIAAGYERAPIPPMLAGCQGVLRDIDLDEHPVILTGGDTGLVARKETGQFGYFAYSSQVGNVFKYVMTGTSNVGTCH